MLLIKATQFRGSIVSVAGSVHFWGSAQNAFATASQSCLSGNIYRFPILTSIARTGQIHGVANRQTMRRTLILRSAVIPS
jgi:hypothetical protein